LAFIITKSLEKRTEEDKITREQWYQNNLRKEPSQVNAMVNPLYRGQPCLKPFHGRYTKDQKVKEKRDVRDREQISEAK
jgi:hypothetical protein